MRVAGPNPNMPNLAPERSPVAAACTHRIRWALRFAGHSLTLQPDPCPTLHGESRPPLLPPVTVYHGQPAQLACADPSKRDACYFVADPDCGRILSPSCRCWLVPLLIA